MKTACITLAAVVALYAGIGIAHGIEASAGKTSLPLWHGIDRHSAAELAFRPYQLGSNDGTIVVDGRITADDGLGFPSFRLGLPGPGNAMPLTAWVKDDGNHLYIAFTLSLGRHVSGPDMDASLYIKQPGGMREYRLRDVTPEFGMHGSFEIPQTKRMHGVFEFKIPLKDIDAPSGSIELAFASASREYGSS